MDQRRSRGGRGGKASVVGDDSSAQGGQGGDAGSGEGGRGGDASVHGDRSSATGGRGGRGGIGPSGRGGDAHIVRDTVSLAPLLKRRSGQEEDLPVIRPTDTYISLNGEIIMLAGGGHVGPDGQGRGGDAFAQGENATAFGGQGGEANQADGRGGRGGRAHMPSEMRELLGLGPDRGHLRWPYYEPITEPGRGADAPDTPQYKARRILVEQIKRAQFASLRLPLDDVWWDRDEVPIGLINDRLLAQGHRWRVQLIDNEYEFFDLD